MLKGRCYNEILKWHFKPIKLKSGMFQSILTYLHTRYRHFLQMLIWFAGSGWQCCLTSSLHSRITCCLLLSLWMHTKAHVCDYCRTPFLCFVFIVNAVCAVILCFLKVKKLNSMIVEKKSALAPIIKELRSLRQQSQVSIIWIIKRELQRNLTAHQTVFVKTVGLLTTLKQGPSAHMTKQHPSLTPSLSGKGSWQNLVWIFHYGV